jgi:hypothetical protein
MSSQFYAFLLLFLYTEGGTRIKARVLRELYLPHPRRSSSETRVHVPVENSLHPDGSGVHLEKLRIELPLNRTLIFQANLILNRNLLSDNYFERRQEEGGSVVTTPTYEVIISRKRLILVDKRERKGYQDW